ncbi:MAG: hypothetical protein EA361_13090 [Bacteroidetes bacterium]|nr:MAG: hypothetical protein EA361_13090 [Bacteroidota bacterium]
MPGYILEEKVEIAKRYHVPKQRREHGLKAWEVNITDAALSKIADGYAREADTTTKRLVYLACKLPFPDMSTKTLHDFM